jgi:hypothetical protein
MRASLARLAPGFALALAACGAREPAPAPPPVADWAAFARDGDPGRGAQDEQPAWTAWDEAGDKYVVLDTPEGGGIRMSRETETLAELVAAIEGDASYPDAAARCTALAFIHRSASAAFSAEQFASAAGGSCSEKTPSAWIAASR